MKLITFAILFLFPAIGLANDSHKIASDTELAVEINIDTISKSKKETQEEYKIRIQKQLYGYDNFDNIDKKLYIKRKNFIIGGGTNFYNKLENNLSLSIGSVLFDGF